MHKQVVCVKGSCWSKQVMFTIVDQTAINNRVKDPKTVFGWTVGRLTSMLTSRTRPQRLNFRFSCSHEDEELSCWRRYNSLRFMKKKRERYTHREKMMERFIRLKLTGRPKVTYGSGEISGLSPWRMYWVHWNTRKAKDARKSRADSRPATGLREKPVFPAW